MAMARSKTSTMTTRAGASVGPPVARLGTQTWLRVPTRTFLSSGSMTTFHCAVGRANAWTSEAPTTAICFVATMWWSIVSVGRAFF